MTRIDGPWRHFDIHANGIRFHVVEADSAGGAPDRPLVLLLHGFGSFWWSWRHQLRGLTGARVVAADLRGYGGSDKPPRGYDGWTLAGDAAGLIRALGHSSAVLIGHGDGGLLCWATALLHPRLVRAVALVSAPHPMALRTAVLTDAAQAAALLPRLLAYQLPFLPEHRLTRHDGAAAESLLRARTDPRWQDGPDFAEAAGYLRTAIQIPAAAHCALEYQRWAVRSQLRPDGRRFRRELTAGTLTAPLLHLRGEHDPFILDGPVRRTRRYAPHGEYLTVPGAGHFSHEETPEPVNAALNGFLDRLS